MITLFYSKVDHLIIFIITEIDILSSQIDKFVQKKAQAPTSVLVVAHIPPNPAHPSLTFETH